MLYLLSLCSISISTFTTSACVEKGTDRVISPFYDTVYVLYISYKIRKRDKKSCATSIRYNVSLQSNQIKQ